MKKLLSVLLTSVIICLSCLFFAYGENEMNDFVFDKKTESINIRDPFVLPYDGLYYMYGTGAAQGNGYGCYVSRDLENWAGPFNVFSAPDDFDGDGCFWAPECHYYNGKFYLLATYHSKTTGYRGTSVFEADSPLGEFKEISDGHITPHNADSIDGTLYVDEQGQPWMVYVGEWTATEDGIGRMMAAKLSSDLSSFISEPEELFKATDAPWSSSFVTDGPFLYKTRTGKLLMLWSNGSPEGYCVGLAESLDGTPNGEWRQQFSRLYMKTFSYVDGVSYNGGHGMLFETFDGRLMLVIHSPNGRTTNEKTGETVFETASFYEIEDCGRTIRIKGIPCCLRLWEKILTLKEFISNALEDLFKR